MSRKLMQFVLCAVVLVGGITVQAQTNVTNNNNGSTNTVPVYTGSSTLGNSPITVSGSNVGIGTTNLQTRLSLSNGEISIGDPAYSTPYLRIGMDSGFNAYITTNAYWNGSEYDYYSPGAYGSTATRISNTWGNLEFDTASGGTNPISWLPRMFIANAGNVGIGTTNPGSKLEVNGSLALTANSGGAITFQDGTVQSTAYTGVICGGDYAESVDVAGDRKNYEPGDVLVIGAGGGTDVLKSSEPYSTLVAGIYSTKPGTVGRRQTTDAKASRTEVPMAMVGIVPTKVSAENGPIKRGDLLVTSSTLGYAMKGTDRNRMLGAVVGKALGNLDSGTGMIEVLVTLQ